MLDAENFQAQFDVQSKNKGPIDWFALNPKFFFNGREVPLADIHQTNQGMIEHDGHYYVIPSSKNLPSLRALNWFWDRISKNSGKTRSERSEDTIHQIPKSQSLELLALRASGVPVIGGKSWQEICNFYDLLDKPRPKISAGPFFKGQLKPFQDLGVQWLLDLYKLKLGGILADDMGLGKTVQALAFLEIIRSKKQLGHCLVVVPTSLTYNWLSESEKFTPGD